MPDNRPRLNIVCYDITDPKRLSRVHRLLVKNGFALQYSVFLVYTDKPGIMHLLDGVRELIDPATDDVRAYPLPQNLDFVHLGRQLLPDGIELAGAEFQQSLFTRAR